MQLFFKEVFKMKKMLCIALSIVTAVGILTGCGASGGSSDTTTTYRAEYKNASQGYIPFVEVTVDADKKITNVTFDWMDENDHKKLKSDDADYKKNWRAQNPDMDQNVARVTLQEQLKETQDIGKIDGVAGATLATSDFKELVTQLMKERVAKGDQTTLVVDNPVEE